jgi:hypothetical protein
VNNLLLTRPAGAGWLLEYSPFGPPEITKSNDAVESSALLNLPGESRVPLLEVILFPTDASGIPDHTLVQHGCARIWLTCASVNTLITLLFAGKAFIKFLSWGW